jgi:hypothetical protein
MRFARLAKKSKSTRKEIIVIRGSRGIDRHIWIVRSDDLRLPGLSQGFFLEIIWVDIIVGRF